MANSLCIKSNSNARFRLPWFKQVFLYCLTIFTLETSWGSALQCSDLFNISNITGVKDQILELENSTNHYLNFQKMQRAYEYMTEIRNLVVIEDFKFLLENKLRTIPDLNQILFEGVLPIAIGMNLYYIDGRNAEGPLDLPVHDLGHALVMFEKIKENSVDKTKKVSAADYKAHLERLQKIYLLTKQQVAPSKNSQWAFEVVWFELFHESYLLHLTKEKFESESERIVRQYDDYYEFIQDRLSDTDISFSETGASKKRDLKPEILKAFDLIRANFY